MEKDDDNSIKRILNNPPTFSYKEEHWDALAKQLDQMEEKPVGYWERYAWLLWLIPFLLLGGWAWHTIQKANQEIFQLKKQVEQVNIVNATIIDTTTIQRSTVYVYDTIYQTKTIYQEVVSPVKVALQLNKPASVSQQLQLAFEQKRVGSKFQQTILTPFSQMGIGGVQQVLNQSNITAPVYTYNEEAIKQPLTDIDLLQMDLLDLPLRDMPLFLYDGPATATITEPDNSRLFLQPTGFSLGIEGSLLKLIHAPVLSTQGFTLGVSSDIHFGNNLSMSIGGEYLAYQYKVTNVEDLEAYPIVTPDNGRDVLNYLRVKSKYLQIPFGFKYKFQPMKLLKPYLGFGLIARKPIAKEIDYEFLGIMEEYYLNRSYNTKGLAINSWRGDIGVELALNKDWNAYIEATYDQDFRKSSFDFERIKYLNLRAGVLYNF